MVSLRNVRFYETPDMVSCSEPTLDQYHDIFYDHNSYMISSNNVVAYAKYQPPFLWDCDVKADEAIW